MHVRAFVLKTHLTLDTMHERLKEAKLETLFLFAYFVLSEIFPGASAFIIIIVIVIVSS